MRSFTNNNYAQNFADAANWAISHKKHIAGVAAVALAGVLGIRSCDAFDRQDLFTQELKTKVREEMSKIPAPSSITIEHGGNTYKGNVVEGVAIDSKSLAMSLAAAKSGLTKCFFTEVQITNNFAESKGLEKLVVIYHPSADFQRFGCFQMPK